MSKVVKGIKKVFKKVVKVAKKIAPVALAVGALVFTGGAALGLAPMAGGWSAAASTVTSALGATGTVGAALTGAITQAGYGALVGGVLGGSEGMKRGAAAGLLTGGATGAYGALRTPAPTAAPTAAAATDPSSYLPGAANYNAPAALPPGGGVRAAAPQLDYTAPLPAQAVAQAAPGGGGLMRAPAPQPEQEGFMARNKDLIGRTVAGVGTGLVQGATAEAYGEGQLRYLRERDRMIGERYEGADPGRQFRDVAPGQGQAPADRYASQSFEYQYDPQQRRIVKVPV